MSTDTPVDLDTHRGMVMYRMDAVPISRYDARFCSVCLDTDAI